MIRPMRPNTRVATSQVQLPDKPTVPSHVLRDYSILIHGEKKIGKTTFFANEPNALFLEWDPVQASLPIYQMQMDNWATFEAAIALLVAGNHEFQTVVVDGLDLAYQACMEATCKRLGISHPHDENDFGKSWGEVKRSFSSAIMRLMRLPKTQARFICHSSWKEVRTRGGSKSERLVPILTNQAEEVLVGRVDIWAAYTYAEDQRVLVVVGDEFIGAGHRIDGHFRTPDGEAVVEIPMGTSSKEAYENFVAAFENRQAEARVSKKDEEGTRAASPVGKAGLMLRKPGSPTLQRLRGGQRVGK